MRESPAFDVIARSDRRGADIDYLDPHVPEVDEDGPEDEIGVDPAVDASSPTTAVVVVTDHKRLDRDAPAMREAKLVVDTRDALREAFSEVSASAIALFCLCLVGAHLLRALRWRYLLEPIGPVPLRSIVAVAWIGFAVILAAPLRSGEIVRPLLITRRGPVGLWEATGTIAAERVVDALVLSLFLVLGLTFVTPQDPLPDHVGELAVPVAAVPSAAALAVVVFTSAFVVMALFYWRRDFARRLVASTVGLVSKRLADTLASVVEKLAQGLRFLPNRRLFVPFVAETMGYWALLSLATFVLMRGVGLPHVTVPEGAVVMGVTGLGILAPAGPGFFGAFQLSAYMALALFHDERALVGAGRGVRVFVLRGSGGLSPARGGGGPRPRPQGLCAGCVTVSLRRRRHAKAASTGARGASLRAAKSAGLGDRGSLAARGPARRRALGWACRPCGFSTSFFYGT
jgi:uncharacterized protein (TIRG00374 family)